MEETAKEIMRESIRECPISGPDTYVGQFRTINGKRRYFGDDPSMVGDNGTLRRSARVFAPLRTPTHITLEMGYGFGDEVNPAGRLAAEYAVPVHEMGELRHNPPTKDHYLEDPVLAHATSFERDIAKRMIEGGSAFPYEVPFGRALAEGRDLGAE